jgi:hypothetical protein
MRILRIRRGFQADHSSSSYLFYAVDGEVSAAGQTIAHKFSSSAEVDEHSARYHKWGESELNPKAYEALLGEHYDVMASESYDWWTLMIAVPKTPEMQELLAPFADARGDNDQGVDVQEYGKRLVAVVYCSFEGNGVEFAGYDEDPMDTLVDLLAKVRAELLAGDTSFLGAVASFYGADDEDEEKEPDDEPISRPALPSLDALTKAELQQQCTTRGIAFRPSWTKARLRDALTQAASGPAAKASKRKPTGRKPKLSRAAQEIVNQLERV